MAVTDVSHMPVATWRAPDLGVFTEGAAARIWTQTGLLIAIMMVPTLIAYVADARQLNGISIWIKPLKFQAAVALHLFTLAIMTSLLAERLRDGWTLRVAAWISSAMGIFEIVYIMAQAGRGRHSHFNSDTPFEVAMYAAMGIGAVTLVATSALVGVLVLRRARPQIGAGLKLGAGLGLVAGSVATLLVAGYLSSNGGHWVGGVASDAAGLPIFGWSTTGGDLRVSHFFATHLMQGLPVIGSIADRLVPAKARRAVIAGLLLWLVVVAATFMQALAGIPFLAL